MSVIKTACVTGADRGIGLELVKRLLERGCKVFAGKYASARGALDELREEHPDRLSVVPLDIGSDASVRQAASQIAESAAAIDLIINNAGILGDIERTVYDEDLDFDEMLQVFNVNALGAFRVVHALLKPLMRSEGKLIANISSEAGSIGAAERTNWYGYCMSKAALNMQAVLLHNQLREQGGQVLLIHPGWVQTHMRGHLDASATYTPEQASVHIMDVIADRERYRGDKPAFVDLLGRPYPW
jgi:NAD(P)-dependent dehydrogenase (short-subunit alcohol dehydrogenase family)